MKDDVVYAELNIIQEQYSLYNPDNRLLIGTVSKETFERCIKVNKEEKDFPNGFYSWRDTFFEMTAFITEKRMQHADIFHTDSEIIDTQEGLGGAGLYDLAEKWADEFEEINKGRDWEDADFYTETEMFAKAKDLGEDYEDYLAEWQAKQQAYVQQRDNAPVTLYNADMRENDLTVTNVQYRALQQAGLVHIHDTASWYWKADLEQINKIIKPI